MRKRGEQLHLLMSDAYERLVMRVSVLRAYTAIVIKPAGLMHGRQHLRLARVLPGTRHEDAHRRLASFLHPAEDDRRSITGLREYLSDSG